MFFELSIEINSKGDLIKEYLCTNCGHITKRKAGNIPIKCPVCKRIHDTVF